MENRLDEEATLKQIFNLGRKSPNFVFARFIGLGIWEGNGLTSFERVVILIYRNNPVPIPDKVNGYRVIQQEVYSES